MQIGGLVRGQVQTRPCPCLWSRH